MMSLVVEEIGLTCHQYKHDNYKMPKSKTPLMAVSRADLENQASSGDCKKVVLQASVALRESSPIKPEAKQSLEWGYMFGVEVIRMKVPIQLLLDELRQHKNRGKVKLPNDTKKLETLMSIILPGPFQLSS